MRRYFDYINEPVWTGEPEWRQKQSAERAIQPWIRKSILVGGPRIPYLFLARWNRREERFSFKPVKASHGRFVHSFAPLITIPGPLFELLGCLFFVPSLWLDTPFLWSPGPPHCSLEMPWCTTVQPVPWLIAHGSVGDVSNCTVCRCVSKRVSLTRSVSLSAALFSPLHLSLLSCSLSVSSLELIPRPLTIARCLRFLSSGQRGDNFSATLAR